MTLSLTAKRFSFSSGHPFANTFFSETEPKKLPVPSRIASLAPTSTPPYSDPPSLSSSTDDLPASGAGAGAGTPPLPPPVEQVQRDIRIYTKYFQRYELLIEYKNLRNPNHCPPGMYIKPNPEDLFEWHGVLFIHRGYYKEGVFKFIMTIPDGYPDEGPSVRFITDMFHPLIDNRDGHFSLRQQFPAWRPHRDFLCHVLHYVKNAFKEAVMANLEGMFFQERPTFAKLAAQCAQLSASEGIVFDNDGPHGEENQGESLVRFFPLEENEFKAKKIQMLSFVAQRNNVPPPPTSSMPAPPTLEEQLVTGLKNVTTNISKFLNA
ncbi:hypothetical protein HDU96_009746 [Phlyctochytrium bullatum]|nr:hypothetical protein HDU96_009746 [Phlyctochytrium bullatum]